jgi:uncharacterized protein with FMN-binding domain
MNFLPKRGVVGGALTVAALVLILSFKTPENLPVVTANSNPNGSTGGGGTQAVAQQTQSTSGGGSGHYTGQLTGSAVATPFGYVQVQVTMQSGKITDVQALQMPGGDRHTQEISSYAAPHLRSEALQAQSAQIDTISGATYTSYGYIQSLQSALDQAA